MLSHNKQNRGTLSYIDFDDLKFKPKRMFFVYGVPKNETRGCHGHRKDQQYITCVRGRIKIKLVSKKGIEEKVLSEGETIFMDKMTWGEQQYLTDDAVAHVLCSAKFDQNDYIHDLNEILGAENV